MKTQTKSQRTAYALRTGIAAVALSCGSIVLNTGVSAQTAPTTEQSQNGMPNSVATPNAQNAMSGMKVTDPQFVTMAGHANQAEIDEARYALKVSKNALVRQFAQKMLNDHSQAAVDLRSAARTVSLDNVPTKASEEQMADARRLMALNGSAFDTEYMSSQIKDHERMMRLLQAEIASTQSASLKAFAQAQLPIVKEHEQYAAAFRTSGGKTLGLTTAGDGVTPGFPMGGSLSNGVPLSNGSSGAGGTSAATGSGVSGSNTGQTPIPAPANLPNTQPTTTPLGGVHPTVAPSASPLP
jgi:putative membrane protein